LVKLDANGKALSYDVFADGWHDGDEGWGRPVDVLELPDGSLLVSDDKNNAVYRITYE
jgi:glucose/arabinose dehydrogenase